MSLIIELYLYLNCVFMLNRIARKGTVLTSKLGTRLIK